MSPDLGHPGVRQAGLLESREGRALSHQPRRSEQIGLDARPEIALRFQLGWAGVLKKREPFLRKP